jgi:NCS1 family nucleobase:cation symporter-1
MKIPIWLYADHSVKDLTGREAFLTNEDLKPVERERRLWGPWNFIAFWLADSININTWMIISSMVLGGLAWWEAWLCVWIGYTVAAIFICLSGRIGAIYHISFPIVGRSSFGLFGSLWPILNRGFMACVWYGVQAWLGGLCIVLIFRSIYLPYETIPNTLPTSSGTNTRDFVGFIVFWALSLIAIWFPVQKIRILFTVKSIIVPVAAVAFFIWTLVKAKGLGPVIHQPGTLTGRHAQTRYAIKSQIELFFLIDLGFLSGYWPDIFIGYKRYVAFSVSVTSRHYIHPQTNFFFK